MLYHSINQNFPHWKWLRGFLSSSIKNFMRKVMDMTIFLNPLQPDKFFYGQILDSTDFVSLLYNWDFRRYAITDVCNFVLQGLQDA